MVAVLLGVSGALLWRHRRARRAASGIDPRRELVSLAAHLARSCRAGATVVEGFEMAAPRLGGEVGGSTTDLVRALQLGTPLQAATEAWLDTERERRGGPGLRLGRWSGLGSRNSKRPDPEDLGLLLYAVQFSDRQGAGLSDAFDAVAVALMDRAELREEVAALSSQARASVGVLCAIPVLGVMLLPLMAPEVFGALVGTGRGLLLLGTAVLIDVAAVVVSSRLCSAVLR